MNARRTARALLYLGIVAAVFGLSKVHAAWVAEPAYDFTNSFRLTWAIAYAVLLALAAYGSGLPDLPRSSRSALWTAAGSAVTAALAVSILQLIVGDALLPRFVVLGSALLLVPWYVVCVAVAQRGRTRAEEIDRILFVVRDLDVEGLEADLDSSAERPARMVGAVEPGLVLGSDDDAISGRVRLVEEAAAVGATIVVLDREAQGRRTLVDQVAVLHESGVRVRTLSLFYEEWLGKLPVSELERVSLMFDIGEVHRARYGRRKRIVDVLFGIIGSIGLLLVIPCVFVVNLAFNRGPLFYSQHRVGKGGEVFTILKFRSMTEDDGDETTWTAEDDPRVTSFGRVLRATHLDELPQVVNILRGELSVVGPRPEQPQYVEALCDKLPFYGLRHLVRPGLTGWAQVKYPYGADEVDAEEKLQYEFWYLRHQSFSLDARIVARTVRTVVGRGGR